MKTRKKSFDVSADHQSNECGSMLTHQLVQTFKTAFSCFYEKKKEKPSFTAASQNYGEKEGASNHLFSASSCRRKAKLKKKNQFPTVYSNTDSFLFHDKNNPNNRQSCILSSTAASSSSSYFFVTPDYVNSLSFTETYNLKDIHDKFLKNLIQIRIENTPTKISEHENTVQYKTPNFRASATIVMAPTTRSETWKIGWIQACTQMTFRNTYGSDGYTSWEFQELTDDKQPMINDCDGCNYPWYGDRDETVVFHTPSQNCQEATIVMNDNFHPHVTWRNPALEDQQEPNLTHIVRNQSFYVWLLAWNMTTTKSYILKNIYWNMNLEIQVDPKAAIGKRARLISPPLPQQPVILKEITPIPHCALCPPNANSAQRLVWNPKEGNPMVIIPPIWDSKKPLSSQIQKYDILT